MVADTLETTAFSTTLLAELEELMQVSCKDKDTSVDKLLSSADSPDNLAAL